MMYLMYFRMLYLLREVDLIIVVAWRGRDPYSLGASWLIEALIDIV